MFCFGACKIGVAELEVAISAVSRIPGKNPRPRHPVLASRRGRSWHAYLHCTFRFPLLWLCYTQPRFAQFVSKRMSARRRALVSNVRNWSRNHTRSF